MGWKLKRLKQCKACPWKVSTDPHDIPDGYSTDLHRQLAGTIAGPDGGMAAYMAGQEMHVMACHEHAPEEHVHCVGWINHQLGAGNNIALRLHMRECENVSGLRVDGEQHPTFEATLPKESADDCAE